jgi:AcrR family transcriptional regulator
VQAAALVFAESGFAGSTTQAIAARAQVSQALLYRHFPSKLALYRAVLRDLLRQQDEEIRTVPPTTADALEFARVLRRYFSSCWAIRNGELSDTSSRVMMASLAGDGRYARVIYRRALKMRRSLVSTNLDRTGESESTPSTGIDPTNAFFFIEHLGSTLKLGGSPDRPVIPYAGEGDDIVGQVLLFCLRGLGLPEGLVEQSR